MARYIDADELILKCKAIISDKWNEQAAPASWANAYADFIDDIENVPTADVQPMKRGKWEKKEICTNCKTNIEDLFEGEFYYDCEELRFCPHCGAKMGDE